MANLCSDRFSAYTGLVPAATASRYSGTAPLGVIFDPYGTVDADGVPITPLTVDPSVSNTFMDLLYIWDFDDPTSGNFGDGTYGSAGSGAYTSRNTYVGPIAAHVYKTAGTYNPTLTVYNGKVSKTITLDPIVVTAADVTFATPNTICVSNTGPSGDFTGAPADVQAAQKVYIAAGAGDYNTALTYLASGKRLLFRAGESWTMNASNNMSSAVTGSQVSKFGSGALPIVTVTGAYNIWSFRHAGISDIAIQDIEYVGSGAGITGSRFLQGQTLMTISKIAFVNVYAHDLGFGCNNEGDGAFREFVMQDCTLDDVTNGGVAACHFICRLMQFGILGNMLHDSTDGEHVLRLNYADTGSIYSNQLSNPDSVKHCLTIRTQDYLSTAEQETQIGANPVCKKVHAANNKIIAGIALTPISQQPTGFDDREGRYTNILYERNWLVAASGSTGMLNIATSHPGPTVIRNNITDLSNAGNRWNIVLGTMTDCGNTGSCVYNNSAFASAGGSAGIMVSVAEGAQQLTGALIKNNIGKINNNGGTEATVYAGAGTPSYTGASNTYGNSSDAQFIGTNPFSVASPDVPSEFALAAASYPIATGVEVPVYDDFFCARRGYGNTTRTIDRGAVKYA